MHEVWHVAVLTTSLFGAAGVALLALAPLVFESPPPGLDRARPLLLGVIAAGIVLVVVEWSVVH